VLIMSLLCAQIQGVFYFLDDISANIPGSIYGLSAQMGRVNCDKELFAAEGGVTGCHAVFLRP